MPLLVVFRVFLKLGLTSFGGPVAHIGYFRQAFVIERQWLTEAEFATRLALCQALPGPASSQLGFLIGCHRAGWLGGLAAWVAFTLPSAIVLVLLALYALPWASTGTLSVVHGLKLVAVAIVAQAVWGMWGALCRTTGTRILGLAGFAVAIWLSGWLGQIGAIVLGAVVGIVLLRQTTPSNTPDTTITDTCAPTQPNRTGFNRPQRFLSTLLLVLAAALLVGLPWLAQQQLVLQMFEAFYRAGALVFGGGHVVLPLLQSAVVNTGLVSNDAFLVGYGLAQAVPGPLFTFAAWLGALDPTLPGWSGAILALVAIFLPGMLLVAGVMPWWQQWQQNRHAMAILAGVNAAVVGVLASAWVDPIVSTSLRGWVDVVIALVCTGWLVLGKAAPWKIVLVAVLLSGLAHWSGLSA
jgi:chromate transporter